ALPGLLQRGGGRARDRLRARPAARDRVPRQLGPFRRMGLSPCAAAPRGRSGARDRRARPDRARSGQAGAGPWGARGRGRGRRRRGARGAVVQLHELLEAADVVTLHVPLTPATRGMIDAAALSRMRPGAFLVNCARAGLVDHNALGRALHEGHLGGCALDVLPDEPPPADQPALSWSRTLLSPHAAWFWPGS